MLHGRVSSLIGNKHVQTSKLSLQLIINATKTKARKSELSLSFFKVTYGSIALIVGSFFSFALPSFQQMKGTEVWMPA